MPFISTEIIRDMLKIIVISAIFLVMAPILSGKWDSTGNHIQYEEFIGGYAPAVNISEDYSEEPSGIAEEHAVGAYVYAANAINAPKIDEIPDVDLDSVTVTPSELENTIVSANDNSRNIKYRKTSSARLQQSETADFALEKGSEKTQTLTSENPVYIHDGKTPLSNIKLDAVRIPDIKELSFEELLNYYYIKAFFFNCERDTIGLIMALFG